MVRLLFLFGFVILCSKFLSAQEITRYVMANGGTELSNNYSCTFGQSFVGDLSSNQVILHQGYQQYDGDASVGIIETSRLSSFDVFPNPATEMVNIRIESLEAFSGQLQLLNSSGQLIERLQSGNMKDWHSTIQVGHLPSGIYTIIVIDNSSELLALEKMIIQK